MATTKITTRQIKGEPNALQARKTNADSQTIDIKDGTYALGKKFSGVEEYFHPDWIGATNEFHVYLDRFDNLVANDVGGFPDLSTRIARLTIVGGTIIAVSDERGHVNGVIDGYQVTYIDGASKFVHGDDVQEALDSIDAYFESIFTPTPAIHVRQMGLDAYDYPNNTIYYVDGYEYEVGESRLLVFINGISQFTPLDYIERDKNSIQFMVQIDHDDVVDILILPGSLGGSGNTTNLQESYNNSTYNNKTIVANNGSINITSSNNTAVSISSSHSSTALNVHNSNGKAINVDGDGYFTSAVTIADKTTIKSGNKAPLNLPILTSDPDDLEDGDTWLSDISGTKKLNARIGGFTYSITLL
jgi:hypothetical protein